MLLSEPASQQQALSTRSLPPLHSHRNDPITAASHHSLVFRTITPLQVPLGHRFEPVCPESKADRRASLIAEVRTRNVTPSRIAIASSPASVPRRLPREPQACALGLIASLIWVEAKRQLLQALAPKVAGQKIRWVGHDWVEWSP